MYKVYKIPAQFVEFMSTLVGQNGCRLNMNVKDVDGNTIIGIEEFECDEFAEFKEQYATEISMFELIEYKPIIQEFNHGNI